MLDVADRWLNFPILRLVLVAAYLALAAAVAVLFPDTPDELSRISIAQSYLDGNPYDFFWPPGNVLLIVINPLMGMLGDVTAVRLFNLALVAVPLAILFFQVRSAALFAVAAFTAPYTFFVLATASQQGLMIGLFVVLLWAVAARNIAAFGITALLLYLVNPAMILILPLGLLFLSVNPGFRPTFATAVLAYLPIAIAAALIWSDTGRFMPTLSGNGAGNIFLGNNPDPMSPRGVGDLAGVRAQYGVGNEIEGSLTFLREDPTGFVTNLAKKAWLHWMPWDFLRSGMGGDVTAVLFTYFALAQIAIYLTCWRMRRRIDPRLLAFVVATCLSAWAVYTLFFVKIRFRIPFDLILLFACLMTPAARRRDPA